MVMLFVICLWQYNRTGMSVIIWVLLGVVVIWALATLYYAPLSIELKDNVLAVNRSLRVKEIPLSEIKMVKLCPPTMAARRLFGSGGYFGYWGWFSEPDLGKYFAYYGKSSECFLVLLRNGKKYILGCENAPAMVNAINAKLVK